ncbi:MAG TPA: hypothetical protein VNZ53_50130 [Steroidobacteraceae bacterium]|jgi:hypothetical protein|nr:hypothetical protein [Steroidobacteraceae bacterium]
MAGRARKRGAKRGPSLRQAGMRAPARYYFSDKRHQFHNSTPLARAALLNGPPRVVAEDEDRVAIVFSVRKDVLRPRCESIRELRPLIDELRLPEMVPYHYK